MGDQIAAKVVIRYMRASTDSLDAFWYDYLGKLEAQLAMFLKRRASDWDVSVSHGRGLSATLTGESRSSKKAWQVQISAEGHELQLDITSDHRHTAKKAKTSDAVKYVAEQIVGSL